jgi:hypothetical protein
VSLLRYLDGTWIFDDFGEKRIRRALDEVTHLHNLASLGQRPPELFNVRVYVPETDPVQCDLDKIRRDIATWWPNEDAMFNLRIVAVRPDASRATAYLIPWSQLVGVKGQLRNFTTELTPFAVWPPAEIDLKSVAKDLLNSGM